MVQCCCLCLSSLSDELVGNIGNILVYAYPCRYADCDGVASNGCEANLNTDAANCGVCKAAATPFANAAPACVNGQSALGTCNTGWAYIGIPSVAFVCATTTVASCFNKQLAYLPSYPFRFGNCDGRPGNGCETNLNTDPSNCGACNTSATPFSNAAPACMDGQPALGTCNEGWACYAIVMCCQRWAFATWGRQAQLCLAVVQCHDNTWILAC
jgi:hypothetical protein